ncbi:MAG: hypothetical protein HN727_05790 [Opitutae bacterium]|nr:hypothetical protein [Opitutae bacterium]
MLGGCRYALGPAGELSFDRLYVRVVQNDSLAPQAGALLSRALREEILREGRARIVNSQEDADAILTVRLIDYDQIPEAYRSDDTVLAASFRLRLFALAHLNSSPSGKSLLKETLFNSNASTITSSVTETPVSRQPLMTSSRSLARKIAAFANRTEW